MPPCSIKIGRGSTRFQHPRVVKLKAFKVVWAMMEEGIEIGGGRKVWNLSKSDIKPWTFASLQLAQGPKVIFHLSCWVFARKTWQSQEVFACGRRKSIGVTRSRSWEVVNFSISKPVSFYLFWLDQYFSIETVWANVFEPLTVIQPHSFLAYLPCFTRRPVSNLLLSCKECTMWSFERRASSELKAEKQCPFTGSRKAALLVFGCPFSRCRHAILSEQQVQPEK